jgi:hypothetical protein
VLTHGSRQPFAWLICNDRRKMKTVISILCTLFWLLAAYAAYAYVYFGWLSATPLSEDQLRRVKYDAAVWLSVFGTSIVAALLLGWWRLRLAGLLGGRKEEPIQSPQRNTGSRPSSDDSPASEAPSSLGPRG